MPVFCNVTLGGVKLSDQVFGTYFADVLIWLDEVQWLIYLVIIGFLGVRSNQIFLKVLNGVKLCNFANRQLESSTLLL